MSMLDEINDLVRRFREPHLFVTCHPDDQWEVRKTFALMTPDERAQFVFNITTIVEPGRVYSGRLLPTIIKATT